MRPSSVSAKILVAFLAIVAMFGAVTAYGALTMRRLGDELRRIASGYLTLRLEVQEVQTRQDSLLRLVERAGDEGASPPAFVKSAVDGARSFRRANLRKVKELVDSLSEGDVAQRQGEAAFLADVGDRLRAINAIVAEDEELFDRLYGRPGARRLTALTDGDALRSKLLRREEKLWRDLGDLSKALRGRVQAAEGQLAADERRAIWATVALAAVAALLALAVMALAQRALAPLRRLAAGAKQIARGDYRLRVDVSAGDEIGALASEFNAMAAALEEREQRLIRSERLAAVGKIAAQITHEVRNPLSSIGLNAEMILDDVEDGEARRLVQAIIAEVDRLTAITEQYLRLARLPQPRLEREDLNAIVSSLLAFQREELAGRGITVDARLPAGLPPVHADENQIRQALLNLLRNAAEAMPRGGQLTVETRAAGEGARAVEVTIADTGDGIPESIRGKIFDPFFSTKAGGTGLGLALTQQIVIEHGGTIDVDSAPGRGTRFVVRLPAAPASPASDDEERAAAEGAAASA